MELIVLGDSLGVFMQTEQGLRKLEGFSKLDFNAGAEVYTRKYFSAESEQKDILSANPEIKYTFDRMKNNVVHDYLAKISDSGLSGKDAICKLVFVDLSTEIDGKYTAIMQSFVVKATDRRPENGFLDYSGSFAARGDGIHGFAILNDDLKTGEFKEKRGGILCD